MKSDPYAHHHVPYGVKYLVNVSISSRDNDAVSTSIPIWNSKLDGGCCFAYGVAISKHLLTGASETNKVLRTSRFPH